MKKLVLVICMLPFLGVAQTIDPTTTKTYQDSIQKLKYGIKFSGFVKTDFFGDSHEIKSVREGHFLLYPTMDELDSKGSIVNNEPSFNFLSIQSRLKGSITGPDFFNAKTSGLIEGDFFGNAGDENGFRLRHAFAKLNWRNTELLTGQFWNPLFVTDCSPSVISFNTGAPFQPFARNPQIRITQQMDDIKLIAALNSQRDFANTGGSTELRNSAQPDFNAQIQYFHINDSTKNEFFCGGGIEYKTVNPRFTNTIGTQKFKVHERVHSKAVMGFAKYKTKQFTYKMQGIYGQNLTDLMMIGGYVAKEISNQQTGEMLYAPINTISGWIDITYTNRNWEYGFFGGYSKNLGTTEKIIKTALKDKTNGYNIDNLFRVAPRLVLTSGSFKIAAELEYTAAAYATTDNNGNINISKKAKVTDSDYVNNTRLLMSFIYNF